MKPHTKFEPARAQALLQEQRAALLSLRAKLDVSQEELAASVKVSARSIARYEKARDPLPYGTAYKLRTLIADKPGMEAWLGWWDGYMAEIASATAQFSKPATIFASVEEKKAESEAAQLIRTALEMLVAFQPQQLNPTEHNLFNGIVRRLTEARDKLMTGAVRCPVCGRPDQTRRYMNYDDTQQPVEVYVCDRCCRGGRLPKTEEQR
jgi:transcriptional regulator with XRE-family HTH domain